MKKLLKEEVIKIADNILNESDIIAKHGTSFANAMSILEEGFYYSGTSMVSQKSKNIVQLCSYGWKENKRGDACNVIISIPKSFIKMLLDIDEEGYNNWVDKNLNIFNAEDIIDASSKTVETSEKRVEGKPYLPSSFLKLVPREFIKGFFIFCDNTNYLDFINDKEESLNHLSYIENQYYFNNLSQEEQNIFVDEFKGKRNKHSR